MVLTPFCDLTEWEEKVKKMSKEEVLQGKVEAATTATSVAAKTLCKPFDQPPLPEGNMCIYLNTIHTYIHMEGCSIYAVLAPYNYHCFEPQALFALSLDFRRKLGKLICSHACIASV